LLKINGNDVEVVVTEAKLLFALLSSETEKKIKKNDKIWEASLMG
jgi:hypothetical protein